MPLRDWVQLALAPGIGPILARRLVAAAGSAQAACLAPASLWREIEGVGRSRADGLCQSLRAAAGDADAEIERSASIGVKLICSEDADYPPLLQTIPDPPTVLYVRGALEPRDLNGIAIVGSRVCSHYGREQAERFAALLAGAGMTIVSGGARGVDTAAHHGAMTCALGRTIAVLGSGVDVTYPPENGPLFDRIAERGAVLSEFPLGTDPHSKNFPRRNRIVSGMSRGVLVIEADERSGALITARQACDDHGRPVFAVPGRVDNRLSAGPHQLIRDGAVLCAGLDDILDNLTPLPQHALEPAQISVSMEGQFSAPPAPAPPAPTAESAGLSERQQLILEQMGDDAASVERLIESTGLPAGDVLRELTFLSLKGLAKRIDGQTFARRRR